MYALNFYSPIVADQLRSRRKTATIRLGDKSGKYRKGMIVQVLCGARYGPREKVFDAVIDKVEVKRSASSRRARSSTTTRRYAAEEMANFLGQLYNRDVTEDDMVTVIRFSAIQDATAAGLSVPGLRIGTPKRIARRRGAPQASQSTANADEKRAPQAGSAREARRAHCGHAAGSSRLGLLEVALGVPAPGRRRPSRRASCRRSSWSQLRFPPRGHCTRRVGRSQHRP